MADAKKMSMDEFAAAIKAKYPQYSSLDNQELSNRILMQHPQYRQHVNMQPKADAVDNHISPAEAQQVNRTNNYEAAAPNSPPPRLAKFEPSAVERTLGSAMDTILGAPSWAYHSIVDPPTPEEKATGQNSLEVIPERLLGGEQTARALQDYGAGKVSPKAAMSVAPEALGAGIGAVGLGKIGGKVAPAVREGLSDITGPATDAVAAKMRYPATQAQAEVGRPGSVKNFLPSSMQRWSIPDWAIPKGGKGTPTNPGVFSKIPLRVPKDVINEESTGTHPNENPTPSTGLQPIQPFPRPLRPLVGMPEDWQAFDQRMSILKPEAKAAGMYSAARGKAETIPDYQQRIGNRLRPFGDEEEK